MARRTHLPVNERQSQRQVGSRPLHSESSRRPARKSSSRTGKFCRNRLRTRSVGRLAKDMLAAQRHAECVACPPRGLQIDKKLAAKSLNVLRIGEVCRIRVAIVAVPVDPAHDIEPLPLVTWREHAQSFRQRILSIENGLFVHEGKRVAAPANSRRNFRDAVSVSVQRCQKLR